MELCRLQRFVPAEMWDLKDVFYTEQDQALLEAMKPWLSEKRRHKVDRAVKIARMAKLAEMAMGEGAGEQKDV